MFTREQRIGEGSEKHRAIRLHTQSRERHPVDQTLNTSPAVVAPHSSSGRSALFSDQDHDMFSPSSTMFGAESYLAPSAINIDDSTNELVVPNRVRQFLSQDTPWVPPGFTTDSSLGNEVSFITHGLPVYRGPNFPAEWRDGPASAPESHVNLLQTHNSFPTRPIYRMSQSAVSTTDNADTYYDDHSMTDDVMVGTTFQGMSLNPNAIPVMVNDTFSNFGSEFDVLSQTPHNNDLSAASLMADGSRKVEDRTGKRRQFFCDYPGCDRTRGFQSDSDLDRHKRGKHGILSSRRPNKAWQCQACLPGKNGSIPKPWDRLDNFRNHCRTAHKNEDTKDLIARSEIAANEVPLHQFADQQGPGHFMEVSSFQQAKPETEPRKESFLQSPTKEEETLSQSSEGKAGSHDKRTNGLQSAGNMWNPFATVTPNSLSVNIPATDSMASNLEGASSPLSLSTSPLLLNTRTPVATKKQETASDAGLTGLVATQETVASHTFSTATLQKFETDLLQSLIEALNLDNSAKERTRHLLADHLQQLTQGVVATNSDEGHEQSPSSSHLSIAGSISTTTSQRVAGKYQCNKEDCKSTFVRQCELTKHEKRHLRPWICVWPECAGKSFGSKADWKRHEGSRHLNREVFKCSSQTINRAKCHREFPRGDQYQIHLKKDHDINDDAILKAKTESDRQIKDLPSEYWCGFCRHMEPYNGAPEDAWNKRIDHIEKHFQEKLTNHDWLPETRLIDGSTQQGFARAVHGSNNTSGPVFAVPTTRQNANKRNTMPRPTTRVKRPRAEQSDDDEVVSAVSSVPRSRSSRQQ